MTSRAKRDLKSLRRRPAQRPPVKIFHIFSEGASTEPMYFDALERIIDKKRAKIKCYGPNGVPKTVATAAINKARELGLLKGKRRSRKLDSYEENDEVWAVFDRDEHVCYENAKQMCRDTGISYAYSDPCFELWLVLHCENYDKPCSRFDIQIHAEKCIKGYCRNASKAGDFQAILGDIERAEVRAERQLEQRRRQNSDEGNPSTNIFELTRRIRGSQ